MGELWSFMETNLMFGDHKARGDSSTRKHMGAGLRVLIKSLKLSGLKF